MSLQEEQPQEYSLRAGLSVLSGQARHRKDLDSEEKSNDQPSPSKESTSSNNSSPLKNPHSASSSSSPSNVKLVGSNRFFMPIKK